MIYCYNRIKLELDLEFKMFSAGFSKEKNQDPDSPMKLIFKVPFFIKYYGFFDVKLSKSHFFYSLTSKTVNVKVFLLCQ